jgi:hypothetical protein
MDGIQLTLVILLAVGYITLLILTIIAVVLVIQILQSIRHITQKAEATTESFSELLKVIGQKIAPAALSSLATLVMKKFSKRRRTSDDEE